MASALIPIFVFFCRFSLPQAQQAKAGRAGLALSLGQAQQAYQHTGGTHDAQVRKQAYKT